MSDQWEKDPMQPEEPAAPAEPAVPAEPTAPVEPAAPATPPMNGFAPDGSYRYVPPRPQPGYYTPPVTPQPPYAPPMTPPPPPPPKKANGWVTALAVLTFGMWGSFMWIRWADNGEDTTQTDPDNETDTGDSVDGPGDDRPIEIKPGNVPEDYDPDQDYYYGDGGLSTEAIVRRNYDCSVVLTCYDASGEVASVSSGIVWTEDGYIITNCHCVLDEYTGEYYDGIDVTLYDGTIYEDAQVIGADSFTDLAVIKVDATDLTPAEFGDSDELEVGARVVALGNAAGLSWTATQGIVSAKGRDVYDDTDYALQCLQVDVAINSGNSGGSLLNKFGQVVGINSAKIAASGYEGLGFAIPIVEAKPILESLKQYGYVKGRVALRIEGKDYSRGNCQGFRITKVLDDSCLEDTVAEDYRVVVITAVDGVTVTDYATLRAELTKHKVGDTITLTLMCAQRVSDEMIAHEVKVVLQEQTAN